MPIARRNRDNLRNHRRFILDALQSYIEMAIIAINAERTEKPIRILSSLKSTRVRLPRNIIPDEFIHLVLAENANKKWRIEFLQGHTDYIQIILHGKPLIEEGQGILLFFLRELLQHLEKMPREAKKAARLALAARS